MIRRLRARFRARLPLAALLAATLSLAPCSTGTAQRSAPDADVAEPPAEEPPPAEQPPPGRPLPQVVTMPRSWEPRAAAEVQALNKIDVRSATLNVPVGQTAQFERLSITVGACLARSTEQGQKTAAFLQIVDSHPGAPGFTGWMLQAEPYLSMMQHPIYDVRIVACR